MTAVSSAALLDALTDIVGREHLLDGADTLAAHAVDAVSPRWVARPGKVEEVSRLLAFASAERLAVTPRGSASALALGNRPRRLDLVLDLSRLDAITEYAPEDMVASVEAGARLDALVRRFAKRSQMLALEPIGGSSRSIGGVLSCNASGPLRARYGTGRDLTLGVRFVQADGAITWGGAKVVKSVTGYDVPKLLVGSLGTLGVIVGATLRLHPLPAATGSWRLDWASREAAAGFFAALGASSLEPDRVTLLNEQASRVSGFGNEQLGLLISFGSAEEAVRSQGSALGRLAQSHGARLQELASRGWERLELGLAGPLMLRLACEPKCVVFWLGELERLATALELRASIVSQPWNGVLQSSLEGAISGAELRRRLLEPVRERLGPEGGSLVVERAPAPLKVDFDVWGPIRPDLLAIMSRVKREFDPEGILNPGRFVGGL